MVSDALRSRSANSIQTAPHHHPSRKTDVKLSPDAG